MSIPYNEAKGGKNSNNKKSLNDLNNMNNSLNNINIELSNNNMNLNQNYLYCNNKNNSKNYYPNYIPAYPSSIFFGQNNFGCLCNNNANILYQLNAINNGQINTNTNFMNKEIKETNIIKEENKNKKNILFVSKKVENNNSNDNNDINENISNQKLLFVNPSQNSTDSKNDSKDNNDININNKEIDAIDVNKTIVNKKIERTFTPYNILNSIQKEKSKEKNISHENNNNINNKQNNLFNQGIPNNNINLFQSNSILGLNMPQQTNELNQLKYNSNIGINDINSASQLSLLSIRNPCFIDLNNLYNNYFQGIEGDENLKQLYNQSRENFFKSCLSINGINSSKNFYPNINTYNYANNYNTENDNNNTSIKQIIIDNSNLNNNENKNDNKINIDENNAEKRNKNEN